MVRDEMARSCGVIALTNLLTQGVVSSELCIEEVLKAFDVEMAKILDDSTEGFASELADCLMSM